MRITQMDAMRKKTIFMVFAVCCIALPLVYSVFQDDIRDHILSLGERIVLTCLVMTPSISWGIVSWENFDKDWEEEQRKNREHAQWLVDFGRKFP